MVVAPVWHWRNPCCQFVALAQKVGRTSCDCCRFFRGAIRTWAAFITCPRSVTGLKAGVVGEGTTVEARLPSLCQYLERLTRTDELIPASVVRRQSVRCLVRLISANSSLYADNCPLFSQRRTQTSENGRWSPTRQTARSNSPSISTSLRLRHFSTPVSCCYQPRVQRAQIVFLLS